MNESDPIREQLWDLIYGLLESDEEETLHARIKSDPAIARLYADTVLEADLLAKAARVEGPLVELPMPREKISPAKKTPAVSRSGAAASASSLARGLHWFAGMGATALALLIAVMLWRPESASPPMAATAKVLEVFGAPQWQTGISNQVKVVARAPNGMPASVNLRLEVRDPAGHLGFYRQLRTSELGVAQLEIPGEAVRPGNQLQVQWADGEPADQWSESTSVTALTAALPAVEESQRAAVTLDRDWYQPGETIRSRAVVLGSNTLEAAANGAVRYEVTGPDGKELAGVSGTVTVTNGVAAAEVKLPADVPEGQYAFRVQGERGTADADGADFVVRSKAPRVALDALAALKQKNATAAGPAGGNGKNEKSEEREGVRAGGFAGGGLGGAANPTGKVTATMGQRHGFQRSRAVENFAKDVAPRDAGAPGVKSESLADQPAAGLEASRATPESSLGQLAAPTNDLGAATPTENARRLKLNLPADLAGKPVKVVVTDARGEVLQTEAAVAKSLDDSLALADPQRRSGAAGFGAVAGSSPAGPPAPTDKASGSPAAMKRTEAERQLAEVEVALAPEVQGPVQTYAVDVSGGAPRMVAQDQRFIPASRELEIHFHDYDVNRVPGADVEFIVQVTDETDRPASGAILGIRVVDEAALQASPKAETLASHWGLQLPGLVAGAMEGPHHQFFAYGPEGLKRQLGRVESRPVQEDEKSLEAATPSNGTFEKKQAQGIDAMYAEMADRLHEQQQVLASAQLGETVLASNREAVQEALHRSFALRSGRRSIDYRFAGQVLVGGALLLALAAAFAYGLRLAPQTKVWVPAITVCAASLVIGLLWIERSSPRQAMLAKKTSAPNEREDVSSPAPSADEAAPASRFHEGESQDMEAVSETERADGPVRLRKSLKEADQKDARGALGDRFQQRGELSPLAEDPRPPANVEPGKRDSSNREARDNTPVDGAQAPAQRSFQAPASEPRTPTENNLRRFDRSKMSAGELPKEKLIEEMGRAKSEADTPPASASGGNAPQSRSATPTPRPAPAVNAPAAAPVPAPAASSPAAKLTEEKAGQEAKKMAPAPEKPALAKASRAQSGRSESAEPAFTPPKAADSKVASPERAEPKAAAQKGYAEANSLGMERGLGSGLKALAFGLGQESDKATADYVPLWAPQLVADEQGQVRVHFTLPKRAANYRVIVDAHGNGRIGSAMKELFVAPAPAEDKAPPAEENPDQAPPK